MKRKNRDGNYNISDGTMEHGDYDTGDYSDFISNGMTNNERIDAAEYYERFLAPRCGNTEKNKN